MRGEGPGTLGFLAAALTSGVAVGLVVVSATVLLVDVLRSGAYPANQSLLLYLIFGGTVAGIMIAGWAAWRLLEPISSLYRRGGLAIVAAFATVLLMLICIPVNQLVGRAGLVILLAVSCITAALLGRRARRLGAEA